MLNGKERIVIGSDDRMRRQIIVNGDIPDASNITINKVEFILKAGSVRHLFNSSDNPESVFLPDENWIIELKLGNQSIQSGVYDGHIKIFDSINLNGLTVQKFKVKVFNV